MRRHKEFAAVIQALAALSGMFGDKPVRNRAKQRELIAEILIANPARTNTSVRQLTGSSTVLINQIRQDLGAPPAKRGRPSRPAISRYIPRQPASHLNGDARH